MTNHYKTIPAIKILIIGIMAVSLSFIFSFPTFAYEPNPTHRLLTQKTAQLYGGFSNEEINWLIQGAIEEDTPPRWVNHFYDPKTGQGWNSQRMGKIPQSTAQKLAGLALTPEKILSAPAWAQNQLIQNAYLFYGGNQTFEKAVYEYVANKNKKAAFIALGHILHLIQDMAVPAHTRQDTHASGDPYEQWAARFTSIDNLDFRQRINCSDLTDCFNQVARYSQENFFSKETINDDFYNVPKADYFKEINEKIFYFKKDRFIGDYLLYIEEKSQNSIENDLIHSSYFSHLAPKAVAGGLEIIHLFFERIKLAEQFPVSPILNPPPAVSALSLPFFSALGTALNILDIGKSTINSVFNLFQPVPQQPPLLTPPLLAVLPSSFPTPLPPVFSLPANPEKPLTLSPTFLPTPSSPPFSPSSFPPPAPQVLGWQSSPPSTPPSIISNHYSIPPETPSPTPEPISSPQPTILPPLPPQITSHQNNQLVEEENITLAGLAPPNSLVFIEYQNQPATTSVSNNGEWQKDLLLDPEKEEHQLIFWLQDQAGNPSATTSLTLILRFPNPSTSSSPEPHLVISEVQISGQIPEDEFVELYNPTNQDLDLTGYQLKRATSNGKETLLVAAQHFAQKSIKSKGYLLLAAPGYSGSVAPDISWPPSYYLAKDNSLILYNSQNQIIDKLGWGKAQVFETLPFPQNPEPSQSLERKALATATAESMAAGEHQNQGNGYDSNDNANDFLLRFHPDPQNSQSPLEPPSSQPFSFSPTPNTLLYLKFDQNLNDDSPYLHQINYQAGVSPHQNQPSFCPFVRNYGLIIGSMLYPDHIIPIVSGNFPENPLIKDEFTLSVWLETNYWPRGLVKGPLFSLPGKILLMMYPAGEEIIGGYYSHAYELTLVDENGSSSFFSFQRPTPLPGSYHLAITFKKGEFLKVYYNGQIIFQETDPQKLPTLADGSPYFQINDGSCYWYYGEKCGIVTTLDEFILENRAWNGNQVQDYYHSIRP